jgi:hypothetical protein
MRNVVVLGSGRSGTSLVAGCLAQAGYYMGSKLLPANESNPKGFFEDAIINSINEDILESVAPPGSDRFAGFFHKYSTSRHQRWLLALNNPIFPICPSSIAEKIVEEVKHDPFCFKDPRFSYTLPVWKPYLHNALFIVVFRNPAATARSIVKECRQDERLHSLGMNRRIALRVWRSMYSSILKMYTHESNWIFLHFDQLLMGEGLERLAQCTGARIDMDFPDPNLRRSRPSRISNRVVRGIYDRLCDLAEYSESRNA